MSSSSRFSDRWSEHHFVSFDKTVIFYRHFVPAAPPRATLLILHGMGEHGGRYRELAEALGGAGVEAYAPDLRGFGRSGGKRGCLRRFSDYFQDLDVVERLAKQRPANLPFFILAHSFGGLVTTAWLTAGIKKEVRGLVLTSPNFGISIHVPAWRHALAIVVSVLAPDFTQDTHVDSRFLTHDLSVFEQNKLDRLNHHLISPGLYREMIRQVARKNEIAEQLTLPALVLQAGDDRVVSKRATEIFFEHLASKDKRLEIFPGLYHEILNETCRRDIYAKIAAWIDTKITP